MVTKSGEFLRLQSGVIVIFAADGFKRRCRHFTALDIFQLIARERPVMAVTQVLLSRDVSPILQAANYLDHRSSFYVESYIHIIAGECHGASVW